MLLDNLLGLASQAEGDAEAYEVAAREAVRGLVAPKGKVDPAILEREQFAAHGLAWIATYVAALRQMRRWAVRLDAAASGEPEVLMLQSRSANISPSLPAASRSARSRSCGRAISAWMPAPLDTPAVRKLIAANTAAVRMRIAELIADGSTPAISARWSSATTTLEEVRRQFRRFVDGEVRPMPMTGTCATS